MFDRNFWDQYYQDQNLPWDMGRVSPPLRAYIDQLTDKNLDILIPGAGNGHEAEYCWRQGFQKVRVLDISPLPLENIKRRIPDFPEAQLIREDFFSHNGQYDLILEQTFFCALAPTLRKRYVEKMYRLLRPGAKLSGLLFTFPLVSDQEKPPFGGSIDEYRELLTMRFTHVRIEECHNSHPARQGQEVFFIARK